ncbi:sulfatase-like hydrolase/transferase [Haloferula rosea]|uniref:Sulfatase-like hydrolase/transferase n=2 Tax=Haloferula rosea TaxID=490093 RepID=A0A934RHX7_9BACT|nr:sulfatase-like hydrolase/transferase [Haloferula rosea]
MSSQAEDGKPTKPNVILIISDDHGFADYSFMGHEVIKTPHIDKMAAESLLYTRGYVMPVCSPSLASLLTGKMPSAHGITGNDLSDKRSPKGNRQILANRLLDNSLMLPKAISEAGYLTFQTGKIWNVTYDDVGFTHGMTDTAGRHGDAGLAIGRKGMKPIYDFIETAQAEEKPFFIWHAPLMPHDPHTPPKKIFTKYKGKGPTPAAEKYFAMVEWFDNTCAELDDYLAKNDLKENTVILYLADNGWDANLGYKGTRSKLSPYENGIRTPMFVRWPGKVEPQRDDKALAHIIDFPTTILDITGARNPGDLKGLNLMDQEALKARDSIHVEAYTHDIADLKDPSKSLIAEVVIEGWWKLIVPGPVKPDRMFSGVPSAPELFNLKDDPWEKNDVAKANPEIVARLKATLYAP